MSNQQPILRPDELDSWDAEQIAAACAQAGIPDSKFESLMIALHYMPARTPQSDSEAQQ